MRRRTLMGAVVGILGLAGCGSSGKEHTDAEWNQLLLDALEPLEHVEELIQFSYSMQGVLGRKDSAWISGIVKSDTDDAAINEALLDEIGKTVAIIHRDNRAKRSRINVDILTPSIMSHKLRDKIGHPVVTFEDLAELYGVER